VSEFVKFIEEDNITTWEHASQFLAQMDKANLVDYLKVKLFPLSLSYIALSWFLLYHKVLFLHGHI
jgi:hypothetical protein